MRYVLDENGYVKCVLWGCISGDCQEYNGDIPAGYSSLVEWADNACINAYYIEDGNLVLDSLRLSELQQLYEQQAVDYSPVLHRELFETNEIIDAQYKKNTVSGVVNVVENARSLAPMIKITGLSAEVINVFAQSKNMLSNDAKTETIGGVTFTRGTDGGIALSGTATEDVVYCLSYTLFAMLQGHNYYLNIGGYECEMLYEDETTEQVYVGASGLITLTENKKVNKVLLKIPSGTAVSGTIYPTLAYGSSAVNYEDASSKVYSMDLTGYTITDSSYVLIGEGFAVLYADSTHVVGQKNMGLLNGYNMIYTDHANSLEIAYTTNEFLVDDLAFLQGKATTSNKFIILSDGSIVATNGTFSGDVSCSNLTVEDGATVSGLVVGDNVTMGPNATITWSNLPGNVASTSEIPSESDITQITKDTISTESLTASNLKITGGSIDIAASSKYDNRISLSYGAYSVDICPYNITVGESQIYSDSIVCGNSVFQSDMLSIAGEGHFYNIGSSDSYPNMVHSNNFCVHTSTTTSNAYCGFNSLGYLQQYSGSSKRHKHDIHSLDDVLKEKFRRLYDLEVKNWTYNDNYIDPADELYQTETYGLIAEDVAAVLPEAAVHDKDGNIDNYRDRQLINAMLVLLQEQKKEIEQLKADVDLLKAKL